MWTVNHLRAIYAYIVHAVDVVKRVMDCFKTGVLELDRSEQQKITALHKELKTATAASSAAALSIEGDVEKMKLIH